MELTLRGLLNLIALILTVSRGNTAEKQTSRPTLVRVVSNVNIANDKNVSNVPSVSSEIYKEVHFDENAKKEN